MWEVVPHDTRCAKTFPATAQPDDRNKGGRTPQGPGGTFVTGYLFVFRPHPLLRNRRTCLGRNRSVPEPIA